MFGIENLAIFIAAGLLLNFTPGPDMLYVATRGASQGRMAGIVSALAIGCGGLVHTGAAALGLSALLGYSALAFTLVKWAGALYLIYLGLRAILTRPHDSETPPIAKADMKKIFVQGMVVSVLNPKVALFFLAFLPQFADPNSGLFAWQIAFLGLCFCFTGTTVNSTVAVFAGAMGKWLDKLRGGRAASYAGGGVFIALGLGLAAAEAK
jgi:threonine/homoserine/homoserine lactone efflux protein